MRVSIYWTLTPLFVACMHDPNSRPTAHAVVDLRPEMASAGPLRLHASFPLATDNPNYKVADSSVRLSMVGSLRSGAAFSDSALREFPAAPMRKNGDFFWTLPESLGLGSGRVEFIAFARDESGFASSDTVRFLAGCPLGPEQFGEYVNPACSR
ncbi:MAG: hypothetical protein JWP91_2572 [Fibrobacteres bacterium]|nr:hypothetical protein [Fibrobacterota bacterium]